MRYVLLYSCALLLIVAALALGITKYMAGPRPYVLITASMRDARVVAMQEFSSKARCDFALGFVNGYAENIGGECVPK